MRYWTSAMIDEPNRPELRGFLIAVIVLLLVGLIGWQVWEFFVADDCLDAGGRWDEARRKCEGARP